MQDFLKNFSLELYTRSIFYDIINEVQYKKSFEQDSLGGNKKCH